MTFAPATPPVLSDQTPGTSLSRSAVLCGENFVMSSSLMVVIAKLASNFRISAPPAVPVTTICSSSSSGCGCWSWAWAVVAASSRLAQAAVKRSAAFSKPSAPDIALDDMGISPLLVQPTAVGAEPAATSMLAPLRRLGGGSGPPLFILCGYDSAGGGVRHPGAGTSAPPAHGPR